jgi:hypothetical protein
MNMIYRILQTFREKIINSKKYKNSKINKILNSRHIVNVGQRFMSEDEDYRSNSDMYVKDEHLRNRIKFLIYGSSKKQEEKYKKALDDFNATIQAKTNLIFEDGYTATIDLIASQLYMDVSVIDEWSKVIDNMQMIVCEHQIMMSFILIVAMAMLVNIDGSNPETKDSLVRQIRNIGDDLDAICWAYYSKHGKYNDMIKALIETTTECTGNNRFKRYEYINFNVSRLLHYLRNVGSDINVNARWCSIHLYGVNEEAVMHPYMQAFINDTMINLKPSHVTMIKRIIESECEVIYIMTCVGCIIKERKKKCGGFINEFTALVNKYIDRREIDLSEFDDNNYSEAAVITNSALPTLKIITTGSDILKETSELVYGEPVYELHAIQLLVNSVIGKMKAKDNTDKIQKYEKLCYENSIKAFNNDTRSLLRLNEESESAIITCIEDENGEVKILRNYNKPDYLYKHKFKKK